MKVWAYIHPELNILCCALLEESIPANVEAIEFDVESTDDIIYDGIRIRLKTEAEKLSELRQKKLQELKQIVYSLLQPTDWVVVKCTELGLDITTEYPEIALRRNKIRQWNNQKKQEIENAQTVEQLNAINLVFGS